MKESKTKLFKSPNALQSLLWILNNHFANRGLQKIYVIIDAIEELEEQSMESLLNLLKPLLEPEPNFHPHQLKLKQERSMRRNGVY